MKNKDMQTKDPALTKTPIDGQDTHAVHSESVHSDNVHHRTHRNDNTHGAVADAILAKNDNMAHERSTHRSVHHNDNTHGAIADAILSKNDNLAHERLAQENLVTTNAPKGTNTFQETVIGTRYVSDDPEHGNHRHEDIHHNNYNVMSTDESIENNTTVNKGTDTFKEGIVDSKHVNDNDNPARQPDRRDQEGNAFDDGVNEHTTIDDAAKSTEINDLNRYANVDNAQTRVLNPDEKD